MTVKKPKISAINMPISFNFGFYLAGLAVYKLYGLSDWLLYFGIAIFALNFVAAAYDLLNSQAIDVMAYLDYFNEKLK